MNTNKNKTCLVYSFGLDNSIDWEARMASVFGCEVYGFDPTSKFNATPAPGVHFRKLGLKGIGSDDALSTTTNAGHYDTINTTLLHTLNEIRDMLGHQGREIDVLRMDCEGCEYRVLNELACNGDGYRFVRQLMVEFHWQKNLGLLTDDDIIVGGDAIQCLEEKRFGIVSLEGSGINPADAMYIDSALKVVKNPFFALFATFRRIPITEPLSWQVFGDVMNASAEKERLYAKYQSKYGGDWDSWPEAAEGWDKIVKKFDAKLGLFDSLYSQSVTYETFETYGKEED